ncbi:MAG: TonB-dependent receptor, partial [Sphingobium sp.]
MLTFTRRTQTAAYRLSLMVSAAMMSPALVIGSVSPAFAQARNVSQAPHNYDISAQPLPGALRTFMQQSGIQVGYPSDIGENITAAPVKGTYSAAEALSRLLAGTGLTYRQTGNRTFTLERAPQANSGAIQLGTLRVEGGSGAIGSSGGGTSGEAIDPASRPYVTAGSSNYISRETIERFRGHSAADLFTGTPGVISGMGSNGAAIDVNIRGLQGMNRVVTSVDGSEQSTSTWRGYAGVDNRSYVDPDLIGGVSITKGPDGGASGAIGGTVAIETLKASDILLPGDSYGARIKVGSSSNGIAPVIGATNWRSDQPSIFDGENYSISAAGAMTSDKADLVVAYVNRRSGNYFAGNHGARRVLNHQGVEEPLSNFKYGDEVLNTSEKAESVLVKATFRPAEDHELTLGYLRYDATFGEVTPTIVTASDYMNTSMRQVPLSGTTVDQISARYRWNPADNDWIDLRANAWLSNIDEDSVYSLSTDSFYRKVRTRNYGIELSNASRLIIGGAPLTLRYGGSWKLEDAAPREIAASSPSADIAPADGTRRIATLFARGEFDPATWLKIEAGLTYLDYHTTYRGTEPYSYLLYYSPYGNYSGSGFSPSAAVTATLFDGWQIFGKYSTGIRPPSLREATYTASALVFNPDLKAEQARNWEVGMNYLSEGLLLPGDKAQAKIAYFNNTTKDYIGRVSNSYVLSLANYDKIRMEGVEFSAGYDAGPAFVDVGLSYYTDFKSCPAADACVNYTLQSDYIANQVPPKFTISATAGARLFDRRLTIGGRVTHMSKRLAPLVEDPTYFFMTAVWAPYTVTDAFAQWNISDRWSLDLAAENLFDRYYVNALGNTDMPAPGRTFRASLTTRLGKKASLEGNQIDFSAEAEAHDWSGFYLGGHLGYGFGKVEGNTTTSDRTTDAYATAESADQKLNNLLGGGQIGFNHQFANGLLAGVEGDFSWTAMGDNREVLASEMAGMLERGQREAWTN